MKPMKVIRSSGTYHAKQKKSNSSRVTMITLAVCITLVVVVAGVLTAIRLLTPPAEPELELELTCIMRDGQTTHMNLNGGDICMLTLPPGVDARDVQFVSSDAEVMRVDSAGRADALHEGSVSITASGEDFEATCLFDILSEPVQETRPKVITTALIANTDILDANKAKGDKDLYSITVNRRTNTVTVYTYDSDGKYTVPIRAMIASCGAPGEDQTITGDFKIYFNEAWHPLYGDVYGMYVSGFQGPYLFHSVPYRTKNHADLEAEEFNRLGQNVSQGCVRMMVADVYWIYKRCPLNTPVHVIDADGSADPLGTPPAVKIPQNAKWDPTDISGDNPYRDRTPVITAPTEVTLTEGDAFDLMQDVAAQDTCGNDITDRVRTAGRVITDKAGVYYLTYTVTDDFHLTATVECTVTVKEKK